MVGNSFLTDAGDRAYERTIDTFDLDDTLVHCNKYFDVVIDQFVDLMLTWFSGHGLVAHDIKQNSSKLISPHSYPWLYA